MKTGIKYLVSAALILILGACGTTSSRNMPSFPIGPNEANWDREALARTAESFYRSKSMNDAEAAVRKAEDIAPDAAVTHELKGHLESFKGNERKAWEHFYTALATVDNDAPYLHMLEMLKLPMTTSQYREAMGLFEEIMEGHPNQNLRRVAAAYLASWRRRLDGDPKGAEAALDNRGLLNNFAVISPFGNDDGKGFSVEYPPERELNYEAEYEGTHFPARWRVGVPLNHQRTLDMGDLVSPGSWVTAYANTYVKAPKESNYLVRVTTTDPIKLWVNDIQVLSEHKVDDDTTDQFIVQVTLRKGWNRILVKSCHGTGGWQVGVGLTNFDGSLVKGLETSAQPKEIAEGPAPGPGFDFPGDLERRLQNVREPMRRLFMAVTLADTFGLTTHAQNLADMYRYEVPDGLFSLITSATMSWYAGQSGDTIDVLEHLIEENGDLAPKLRLFRASFFEDQRRHDRAREDLQAAVNANSEYRTALIRLASNYRQEGWTEDYLEAMLEMKEKWPDDTRVLWGLAAAYIALGRVHKAEKVHREILDSWKGAQDVLEEMISQALRRNDYDDAVEYREQICEIYPSSPTCYYELGGLLRRAGENEKAIAAFEKAREIDNRWAAPIIKMGSISYEAGDKQTALNKWKEALEYDPDNHSLADRVEFVAPTDAGMLSEYEPSKEYVKQVLAKRGDVKVAPGSNLVMLLDHAVEQMERDGSSRKIVTQIIMAVNDTGRDQLTQQYLEPGRLKVMEAYVLDPDGTRREASSLRGHEVRFRELKVGSTVVMKYRVHTYPSGYLARYPSRRWFFHGVNSQFEDSTYVLILPEDMDYSEWGHGSWKRGIGAKDGYRVITYEAKHTLPLVTEPGIPHIVNLLEQVAISMNPSWENIAQWDKALLMDAFRSTPQTDELAKELTADAKTKREKVDALTRFVMREIRYQQDYENTIAGVKPHTAAVVLQRGYGDCKDKSVLIMTMAEALGIKTRFAILRTTGVGDFIKDLPFLQFNHAIVYIPKQDGIEKGFFVDATPDTLDLSTLRPDDQGTEALTIDVESGKWEFVEIPFTPAQDQFTIRTTRIEPVLDENGEHKESKITISFAFQGPTAAGLRPILRNKEETSMFISHLVTQLFPGASVDDHSFEGHDDIVKPLTLNVTATSTQVMRAQGDTVVVDLPKSENLSKFISLKERKLPLQTGLFLSYLESTDDVVIPAGHKIQHVPEDVVEDNEFFHFERTGTVEKGKVKIDLKYEEKTTRIDQKQYPAFKAAVTKVVDALKQDLVLKPSGKKKGGKKKKSEKKASK